MAQTNFAVLTNEELTAWSMDIWKAARNAQFLHRFMGDSSTSMIQRITELTKTKKGARAVMTLVADLEGDGVAGDRTLEGNEESMKSYDQVIQLDQLRHANRHEGRMAEQRSVVKFRKESKDVLAYWLADRMDQLGFLTMSGVDYSMTNRGAARVGSDFAALDFAGDVTAPSANRVLQWDAVNGLVAQNHAALVNGAIGTGDYATWAMLVEAKAYAHNNYIKPIRMDGGVEIYNVFMTPDGIAKLKQDQDFLKNWRESMPRTPDHPLFKGANVIYVDGLAIHEYRHVYNTLGAVSGVGKWGTGLDVDGQRVLLCGAQAMGFADIGMAEWNEKEFDYGNQPGISVGKIMGMKKPVFRSQITDTDEDFGILAIDTAIQAVITRRI